MDRRLYGTHTDINEIKVCEFYDKRARRTDELGDAAVLLGDSNPQAAIAHNEFENRIILPKLQISPASRFLDIGCGIGRIAKSVIPQAAYYCGTDLSPGMISSAESCCASFRGNYDFFNLTLTAAMDKTAGFFGGTFDIVFSSGVFMYINDDELRNGIAALPHLLSESCICYFENTVAIHERLTLNEFPSESLKDNYSAIYRTREEYYRIYKPLIDSGFHIAEEQLIVPSGSEGTLAETERWYLILKREK